MRVSLDGKGNMFAASEYGVRDPSRVEEHEHAVGKPHQTAEKLRAASRKEEAKIKLAAKAEEAHAKKEAAKSRELAKRYIDVEAYTHAVEEHDNGGEHPLMYLAALQSMSGTPQDYDRPFSGSGLSTDGQPAFDRGMGGFLDDLRNTVSNVTNTVQNFTPLVQSVQQIIQPNTAQIEAARAAAYQQALAAHQAQAQSQGLVVTGAAPASILAKLLAPKVAGVPVIPVAVGLAVVALILMKRR